MIRQRMNADMWEIELEYYKQTAGFICGVDEAGRGPLAGPVYAAAVILPQKLEIIGLDDSKKVSEKKRDELFDLITQQAVAYSVSSASVEEIEKLNILNATFLAMNRAIENLEPKAEFALIDGNRNNGICIDSASIVKGDSRSASIAAASILAKVSRDRYMLSMAEKYPQYSFEKHKGYGTKLHYSKLLQYGPCPIHRMSFLKNLESKR